MKLEESEGVDVAGDGRKSSATVKVGDSQSDRKKVYSIADGAIESGIHDDSTVGCVGREESVA